MAIDKITLQATDNLFVNTEITGTEAAKMPVGTTAQRANVQAGDIRFNSTTALMEYYDGTQWKSIDSPPAITSISPSNIADSDNDVDITITGSNFIIGGQTVTAIGANGSTITAATVTRVSATELTANFDGTSFDNAQEPYDIKVENTASSLSITSADVLNVNASPAWTVSAGSLGTIYDSLRTGVSFTTGATDSEGATLTYSVSVGSLPAGLSIDSSTGTISGNATAVGSDTTSTFTLSVTDGTNTVTRQYSIAVLAPVITSYTSTGSGTFSVPSGITAVDVLVVAGGGGGASYYYGAGGGAGGLIYRPAFPVTPGGSVSYSVGGGAASIPYTYPDAPQTTGNDGQNSSFGTLTAVGGGGGARQLGSGSANGRSGGSGGGGASSHGGSAVAAGGPGQQPSQPGDSGTYGFGSPGGSSDYGSGGGGGAGGSGGNAPNYAGGAGGVGKQYDISGSQVYYAGGGGAAGDANGSPNQGGTGGQGGGGSATNDQSTPGGPAPLNALQQGQANRGGGGGGGYHNSGVGQGGAGGSGIVIVKY